MSKFECGGLKKGELFIMSQAIGTGRSLRNETILRYKSDAMRIRMAEEFATQAHKGQLRRFGEGEAYIEHPKRVAKRVSDARLSVEAIQSALLHDVVEDCDVTSEQIYKKFGDVVGRYVDVMTDIPYIKGGPNRAARKEITRNKFLLLQGLESIEVATIKVADCIDNAVSIKENDPDFWRVFRKEIFALSGILTLAEPNMHDKLRDILEMPRRIHTKKVLSLWEYGELKI